MNIIDLLLMLIFFCAIAFYWHKLHKKRAKDHAETATTRPPEYAQPLQEMPYTMGTMADNPALTGPGAPTRASMHFCKFIAVPLKGAPSGLPFDNMYDSSEFNTSLMTAGYEINEELKALAGNGFTTFAITPAALCTDMLVLCITAGK